MLDETKTGLDVVEGGPQLSGKSTDSSGGKMDDPDGHPSVIALFSQFGDAVSGHRVFAGTQHVVWIDSARNLEILRWLREQQDHQYDMISDITAVDYGAGRPIEVVYQLFSTVHKRAL